jgi:hypothetical protein
MFGADRNVQHWVEPRQSAGVGNSASEDNHYTINNNNYHQHQ